MTFTGTQVDEVLTGLPQAPDGPEGRQCYVTEHASLSGFTLIDCSTDIESVFGAGSLADELITAQANAGQKFWAAVYCLASGELVTANIGTIVAAVAGYGTQVSTIIFLTDADATFADAVKTALETQANQKKYFEPVLKYRKAYSHDLSGLTATQNAGSLEIDLGVASNYEIGDDILINDSGKPSLSGKQAITAKGATSVTIVSAEATFDFPAGAEMKEHPDDYVLKADDEFDEFSSDGMMIVAPTSQDNWTGAITGRISKIKVHVSAGRVADGGLVNVDTDSDYAHAHLVALDAGRFAILKRFVEDPTEVFLNDDNVMFSGTSDVTTMARRRVINKGKRLVHFYAFPTINDHKYPKDKSGAMAATEAAATGLKEMKRSSPVKEREISEYELECDWITGGLKAAMALYDVNRIKIFEADMSITDPQE